MSLFVEFGGYAVIGTPSAAETRAPAHEALTVFLRFVAGTLDIGGIHRGGRRPAAGRLPLGCPHAAVPCTSRRLCAGWCARSCGAG